MKSYLLAMTYGPIMPIAYPITAISFVVEYWVDKYILLRRHCRPETIGKYLDSNIIKFIPIGVLLNCITGMVFFYDYNTDTLAAGCLGLVISFLFLVTPWQRLIKLRKLILKIKLLAVSDVESFESKGIGEGQKSY